MKKHPLPAWLGCLLLIALTIVGTLRLWLPITAESGEEYILQLERAWMNGRTMCLDFAGADDLFHLPRDAALEALLEPEAVGRSYRIIADYHARRHGSDYYDVYALYSTDGKAYLTIDETEALRHSMLPLRITLVVLLDAAVCGLVLWRDGQRRKAAEADSTA